MAITYADLQPYLSNLGTPAGQTPLPSYGNIPSLPTYGGSTPGKEDKGNAFTRSPAGTAQGSLADILTHGDYGLFSSLGLFGGDEKPQWNPYAQNGQYYWGNPANNNPVPIATVPGANQAPDKTYRSFANQAQALQTLLPYIGQAINGQQLPSALSDLNTAQVTQPGYAQLQTQLFNQFGPQLNAIGNEIQRRNALAQAGTENDVLTGPGKDLVSNAYNLSQVYDKPYYDSRQTTSDSITKLINSIDLSGGLSSTERDEIGKGLARSNQQAGTQFAPSQTNTVSNAMRYGQAGYNRQQQAKSNLSDAISKASAFLPTAKSGVDVFQVATGRPSQPNPGASLVPSATTSGNSNNFGLAGNLLGGMTNTDINNSNIQANQKDWLDKFTQLTGGISNIASSVGSLGSVAGAACWIAREIYGVENPKWLLFRSWLLTKASKAFKTWYIANGERIASEIKSLPEVKQSIQRWMDSKILTLNY